MTILKIFLLILSFNFLVHLSRIERIKNRGLHYALYDSCKTAKLKQERNYSKNNMDLTSIFISNEITYNTSKYSIPSIRGYYF